MPRSQRPHLYGNRRMAALVALGFASGLPGAWTLLGPPLQAWLGQMQVDLATIGLFGLVALPFTLNFAWAPLMDRFTLPWMADRRRGWLQVIQWLLLFAIAGMALVGPTEVGDALWPLVVGAMVVAFLAATQDVVADAYRTDVLEDHELGAGAAVFVNGYRIAMAVGTGGSLMAAGVIGWRWTYLCLALLMGIGLLGTRLSPKPPHADEKPTSLAAAFTQPVLDFFTRHGKRGLLILLFAVLFKLPDATARVMTTPLLQTKLGLDLAEIGLLQSWLGMGVTMIGAMLGGIVIAKMGLMRAMWLLAALQMLSNLGFSVLAAVGPIKWAVATVIGIEALCGGMVTVGFIAFLMAQCNRRYSASQYALFTSLNALTGILTGAFTGYVVQWVGFEWFFVLTALVGLPAVVVLALLHRPE